MISAVQRLVDCFTPPPEVETPWLELTGEGFRILWQGRAAVNVRWSDVDEIIAYKRDLFSHDEICVSFGRYDHSDWIEIAESWDGFLSVTERMTNLFPTVGGSWYGDLMLPAFEPCWTLLYRRSGALH